MDQQNAPLMYRSQLLADGFTDRELQRMYRSGELALVRRGCYVAGSAPPEAVRHRMLAAATIDQLAHGAVLSHASAAVMYGFPCWPALPERVQVTRPRSSGGRNDSLVHMYCAPLSPDEIVVVEGVPVTSVARTVVDLARTVSFEAGVVFADAALACAAVTVEQLSVALLGVKGWPGAPRARRVVEFADGRAESVGESRSRVALARAGFPVPVPQWEVRDVSGRLIGRVDFGWPEWRVVGEFDGRIKYGELVRPGSAPGDVLFAEKLREDSLRAESLQVIRWTWQDLRTFGQSPAAARLRRALTRG